MRAVVVYESMYGNTHTVATRVADGLRSVFDVTVVPVADASAAVVDGCDLVVVGGPTHVHGMSSAQSRKAAVEALKKDPELTLDPDAEGPSLRDWFKDFADGYWAGMAAAFDTRIDAPAVLTGRASKGIARRLRQLGFRLAVYPESFLVDKKNHLLDGEAERAEAWGAMVAATVGAEAASV